MNITRSARLGLAALALVSTLGCATSLETRNRIALEKSNQRQSEINERVAQQYPRLCEEAKQRMDSLRNTRPLPANWKQLFLRYSREMNKYCPALEITSVRDMPPGKYPAAE